jgi:hypothetical protein
MALLITFAYDSRVNSPAREVGLRLLARCGYLCHLASKLGLNLVYIYRTNFRSNKGSALFVLQTSYEF